MDISSHSQTSNNKFGNFAKQMLRQKEQSDKTTILDDRADNIPRKSSSSSLGSILRIAPRYSRSTTQEESFGSSLNEESSFKAEDLQRQNNSSVNFGKVAIVEFDKTKASVDTIERDRWAATRPETNQTFTKPSFTNLRGLLPRRRRTPRLIQPELRQSPQALQPQKQEKLQHETETPEEFSIHRNSILFLAVPKFNRRRSSAERAANAAVPLPRIPHRRSSCEADEGKIHQPQQQEKLQKETQTPEEVCTRRSSFLYLAFPKFQKRRSSAERAANAAIPLPRPPHRRSSCAEEGVDLEASQTQSIMIHDNQ